MFPPFAPSYLITAILKKRAMGKRGTGGRRQWTGAGLKETGEVKGKVKEKWGKLTDDDLTAISGKRDQLEGRLQQRYGFAKDLARRDVDTWFSELK
jgi:uncharacterized protein YjbJ (UPF0337 family)